MSQCIFIPDAEAGMWQAELGPSGAAGVLTITLPGGVQVLWDATTPGRAVGIDVWPEPGTNATTLEALFGADAAARLAVDPSIDSEPVSVPLAGLAEWAEPLWRISYLDHLLELVPGDRVDVRDYLELDRLELVTALPDPILAGVPLTAGESPNAPLHDRVAVLTRHLRTVTAAFAERLAAGARGTIAGIDPPPVWLGPGLGPAYMGEADATPPFAEGQPVALVSGEHEVELAGELAILKLAVEDRAVLAELSGPSLARRPWLVVLSPDQTDPVSKRLGFSKTALAVAQMDRSDDGLSSFTQTIDRGGSGHENGLAVMVCPAPSSTSPAAPGWLMNGLRQATAAGRTAVARERVASDEVRHSWVECGLRWLRLDDADRAAIAFSRAARASSDEDLTRLARSFRCTWAEREVDDPPEPGAPFRYDWTYPEFPDLPDDRTE